MAEKKVQKTKVQSDHLSDSDTPDKEVDPQLRMSEKERIYRMIEGSTQATQAVLSHTNKQVPVLNLTETSITSQADLQDAFQSLCLCFHGGKESTEDKSAE